MNSQSPLRVLHVVLDMDLGGLQRVVQLLLQGHDRQRFLPFLCALDRGGIFYENAGGDSVKRWVLGRRPGLFDSRVFWGLYKIVKEHRIDIIHSHNGCGLYAVLAGRLGGVKGIIHTDHGRLVPDRLGAILEDRYTSYLMDRFVGVSEELTQYLAATIKVSREKLLTVVNGIDTTRFVPVSPDDRLDLRKQLKLEADNLVLGTVCRLDPIKNLAFLVERMCEIGKRFPRCKLVIVGDGPDKALLANLIAANNLAGKVVMAGRMEKIEQVLPAFDAYVCSSLSEGTSMTILEAMACGLPIVATAVGGNVRIVDGETGYLYPLNDGKAFDEIVSQLLESANVRHSLGAAGRLKVVREYGIDKAIKLYEDWYVQVAASRA